MLPPIHDYDRLYREFRWPSSARYNIGVDVCDRWAMREPDRAAIIHVQGDGRIETLSFGALMQMSNRLANALRAHGIGRGDRVAILLPQSPEAVIAHVAIYKLGAIALPLALLFGTEALAYRLQNSGAKVLITNELEVEKLASLGEAPPDLRLVVSTDGEADGASGFAQLLQSASDTFAAEDTSADDPAMMIYTSGTTGPPKGALHAHRVLLGHMPGIELPTLLSPQRSDLFCNSCGLGLGRRSARRAVALAASRRRGGGTPVRQVRPGRGLCIDGAHWRAQRLHPADRAADAAFGTKPTRAIRSDCEPSDRAVNRSAPRHSNGAGTPSA